MIDYSRFRTSADVKKELAALHELDRHQDDLFHYHHYGKRRERLLRMYWILYRREAADRKRRQEREKKRYEARKAAIRDEAIDWSCTASEVNSWDELADRQSYFLRLGRRYGLLQEFRENGIC